MRLFLAVEEDPPADKLVGTTTMQEAAPAACNCGPRLRASWTSGNKDLRQQLNSDGRGELLRGRRVVLRVEQYRHPSSGKL